MANWDEYNAAASRGISPEARAQAEKHIFPSARRHLQEGQFGPASKEEHPFAEHMKKTPNPHHSLQTYLAVTNLLTYHNLGKTGHM